MSCFVGVDTSRLVAFMPSLLAYLKKHARARALNSHVSLPAKGANTNFTYHGVADK